jgi:hypothetical protein
MWKAIIQELLQMCGICFIVLIIFLCLIGCNTPFIPTPKPEPIQVRIPAQTDYKPILAWEIAKNVDVPVPRPNPKPTPNPTPRPEPSPTPIPDGGLKPGDDCPAPCEGGWEVHGDGHKTVCWKCNGDGRVDEGDPILSGSSSSEKERVEEFKGNEGLVPETQSKLPTLAPLPEIRMIAPITIHVQKGVAEASGETVYSIEKDGMTCTWNEDKKCFVCPDGEEIEVQNLDDISKVKEITINYGDYFRRFSVREHSHDNAARRKEP